MKIATFEIVLLAGVVALSHLVEPTWSSIHKQLMTGPAGSPLAEFYGDFDEQRNKELRSEYRDRTSQYLEAHALEPDTE